MAYRVCFNPHRLRRAGATLTSEKYAREEWFQSSPAPKSRCNCSPATPTALRCCFNPHRLRRAGATACHTTGKPHSGVSILTGSEEPVQRRSVSRMYELIRVSILTGSEEPVQRLKHVPEVHGFRVSILTGSEEPVQPRLGLTSPFGEPFQSSPAPKSRCNRAGRNRP